MLTEQLSHDLTFTFFYTVAATKLGAPGLTVTVTVWSPAGTRIVDAASATEVGIVGQRKGLYEYTLSASLVATAGVYRAVAYTADGGVTFKEVYDTAYVPYWVNEVAELAAVISAPMSAGVDYTLAGLRQLLRTRLNDSDGGNYTATELDDYMNMAARDTAVFSRCYLTSAQTDVSGVISEVRTRTGAYGSGYAVGDILAVLEGGVDKLGRVQVTAVSGTGAFIVKVVEASRGTGYTAGTKLTSPVAPAVGTGAQVTIRVRPVLTDGTHTYALPQVFAPTQVSLGDDILDQVHLGDAGVMLETWDHTPPGAPARWIHLFDTTIRIHPPPDALACSRVGAIVIGTGTGSGYALADIVNIVQSGGSGAQAQVTKVTAGTVTGLALLKSGTGGYTVANGVATTKVTGNGTGLTVNITALATLKAYGPAYPNALLLDTDELIEVPTSHIGAVLDRAEALARSARPTSGGNLELHGRLMQTWARLWVPDIENSLKGEG